MVGIKSTRQTWEALYDLLMEQPERMLHDGDCEDFAKWIAENCGFRHERIDDVETG